MTKMDQAPLTNSGCESNFAQLDLECRRGSGQTTLQTMSSRHLVKTNKYFDTDEWKQLSTELKAKCWKDARSGQQAKIVKEMQKEFINKVKAAEALSNQEKIRKKSKKNAKFLKLLEELKEHGGPITPNDLDVLDTLTDLEILSEVRYLRQTVAPNIREKRKVNKKFVKFSRVEMIDQIKGVLKPENEDFGDIDALLLKALKDVGNEEDSVEKTTTEPNTLIGTVALCEGPLGEKKIGVVLSEERIQFYQPSRYGLEPEDCTSEISDWKVTKKVEDFDFIRRRTGVYLRCSLKGFRFLFVFFFK